MSDWAARRFYRRAEVAAAPDGFAVLLDGKPVRTPAKRIMVLPTAALADEIAAEWSAQDERIDPPSMPFTRAANSAIDKVRMQRREVVALLTEYGGTDMLCYRASGPEELVARQSAHWDPPLDWAAVAFGARLRVTSGVMPISQDEAALAALRAPLERLSEFQLAGAHDLVALSGSLVLALAAMAGWRGTEALWDLSRLDEAWQAQLWGEDGEAMAFAAAKREQFLGAARFEKLARV